MSRSTKLTGNLAENAVARELARKGHEILDQNWKIKFAEIDLVSRLDKTLYFTEVKYRKTTSAGDGFDYITSTKLHHMHRAAEAYVLSANWTGEYLLQAASVVGEFDNLRIEIIEI